MRFLLQTFIFLMLVSCQAELDKLAHLHGKSEADVVSVLGLPSYTGVMTLEHGSTLPELYIEIHNTYAPSDPNIDGVMIKELRWDRMGYTEAVFMHRIENAWLVLESCRWKDGVVF